MDELQRRILEALERVSNNPDWANLHTIWEQCGSEPLGTFRRAWDVLEENGYVEGDIHSGLIIAGTGRITGAGEQALKDQG